MSANNEPSPYTSDWLRGARRKREGAVIDSLCSRKLDPPVGDIYEMGSVIPAQGPALKDHEIRECINEVRRIALNYGGSQQLRERLASYLAPILRGERRP